MVNEKEYSAEYHGSGTFVISKPKRKSRKLRQAKLKKPQRGARNVSHATNSSSGSLTRTDTGTGRSTVAASTQFAAGR